MSKFKIYFLYPAVLLAITSIFYLSFLLSSNFTPRMYFYTQEVQLESQAARSRQFLFHSKENYLGIITVYDLGKYIDYSYTNIYFRIREHGADEWIAENRYSASDFINREEHQFGLPIVQDSENKTYVFELEAECSESDCTFEPPVEEIVVRHYFSKQFLLSSPEKALQIIMGKVFQNYLAQPLAMKTLPLVIPLAAYFALMFFFSQYFDRLTARFNLLKEKYFAKTDYIVLGIIALDVLTQSTIGFWLLLVLFIMYIVRFKQSGSFSFLLLSSLLLYCVSLGFVLLAVRSIGDRFSLWSFMLLALATVELFLRARQHK